MAYCRFGCDGSDVYCYASTSGGFDVWLPGFVFHKFSTAKETADFLDAQRKAGLTVPQYAIDYLRDEGDGDE